MQDLAEHGNNFGWNSPFLMEIATYRRSAWNCLDAFPHVRPPVKRLGNNNVSDYSQLFGR